MTGLEAFFWVVAVELIAITVVIVFIGGVYAINSSEKPRELTADEIADRAEMFVTPEFHSTGNREGPQYDRL
jgi:hypothetical protein